MCRPEQSGLNQPWRCFFLKCSAHWMPNIPTSMTTKSTRIGWGGVHRGEPEEVWHGHTIIVFIALHIRRDTYSIHTQDERDAAREFGKRSPFCMGSLSHLQWAPPTPKPKPYYLELHSVISSDHIDHLIQLNMHTSIAYTISQLHHAHITVTFYVLSAIVWNDGCVNMCQFFK